MLLPDSWNTLNEDPPAFLSKTRYYNMLGQMTVVVSDVRKVHRALELAAVKGTWLSVGKVVIGKRDEFAWPKWRMFCWRP